MTSHRRRGLSGCCPMRALFGAVLCALCSSVSATLANAAVQQRPLCTGSSGCATTHREALLLRSSPPLTSYNATSVVGRVRADPDIVQLPTAYNADTKGVRDVYSGIYTTAHDKADDTKHNFSPFDNDNYKNNINDINTNASDSTENITAEHSNTHRTYHTGAEEEAYSSALLGVSVTGGMMSNTKSLFGPVFRYLLDEDVAAASPVKVYEWSGSLLEALRYELAESKQRHAKQQEASSADRATAAALTATTIATTATAITTTTGGAAASSTATTTETFGVSSIDFIPITITVAVCSVGLGILVTTTAILIWHRYHRKRAPSEASDDEIEGGFATPTMQNVGSETGLHRPASSLGGPVEDFYI